MQKSFGSFREASAFAASYCREHRIAARLSRDGEQWMVTAGSTAPIPPSEPPSVSGRNQPRVEPPSAEEFRAQQWQDERTETEVQTERRRIMLELSKAELSTRDELPKEPTARWETCHQCGGDGGAGGRCPRCGGTGFEPHGTE